MSSRLRHVLIHYHIFKNAGVSLDHALQRSFGERWQTFEGAHATDILSADQMRQYLATHEDVIAVSSHLARPPLPWVECRPLIFLRHPLDRARSVFEFVATDRTQPYGEIARTRGVRGYFEWALTGGDGGVVIRNYQVVHLSHASWRDGDILRARATAADLLEAKSLLGSWPALGLVDCYARSLQLFTHAYGPLFPGLDLAPVHLNVTRPSTASIDQRIDAMHEELGADLFARLVDANALDLELYVFARQRFEVLCAAWPVDAPVTTN